MRRPGSSKNLVMTDDEAAKARASNPQNVRQQTDDHQKESDGLLTGKDLASGRGYNAFWGAFLLAWPGLVIGGLVGASNTHEVWRPMADRSVRVAIAPTAKGGAQFTARMSF